MLGLMSALKSVVGCFAMSFFGANGIAGPLTPAVGPVVSTNKTLAEVEPRIAINATNTPGDSNSMFRISQPGSYYLTANITGVNGESGIEIGASNVTIDLTGFTLQGVSGSFDGISIDGAPSRITIRNGVLTGWGGSGVDLGGTSAVGSLIENIHAASNGDFGIRSTDGGIIRNCVASANVNTGIIGYSRCVIESCLALQNGGGGISTGGGSTVRSCVGRLNSGAGVIANNMSTIENCTAESNLQTGIQVTSNNLITHCVSVGNTLNGIQAASGCVIIENHCATNGSGAGDGAGIRTSGANNRIEGNNCISADRGIEVAGTGNIIMRNSCSDNTVDWVIAANNIYGPIVDRRTPASAAVSGFTAATTLGSTDSHANFSY